MIEPQHPTISIRRQCQLLGLSRASFYREPAQETALNLQLMRLIDEQYTKTPFYGYPKMTVRLRELGYPVNEKRVARLMHLMGLQAVRARVRTSQPNPEQRVYPYLLRDLNITQPNHVWCADITYVPMPLGFMYLVAIMDWFSRYVLAWELSNTLDVGFCVAALQDALEVGQPVIFNTDQVLSLRHVPLPPQSKRLVSGSAWTDVVGSWIISSSSDSGDRSNTRTSTLRSIERLLISRPG